jgi:hypothetical protein
LKKCDNLRTFKNSSKIATVILLQYLGIRINFFSIQQFQYKCTKISLKWSDGWSKVSKIERNDPKTNKFNIFHFYLIFKIFKIT